MPRFKRPAPLAAVLLLCGLALAQEAPPASFQGLGTLSGSYPFSHPAAISADGSTVVGEASVGDQIQGFVWRRGDKLEPLGCFQAPAGEHFGRDTVSRAFGVSADGKVVVGDASDGTR